MAAAPQSGACGGSRRCRLTVRLCLALGFALSPLGTPTAQALERGASREAAIAELGQPVAISSVGNREILTFASGAEVEFTDGFATRSFRLKLQIPLPPPEPPPAPPPVATAPAPTPLTTDPLTELGIDRPRALVAGTLNPPELPPTEVTETTIAEPTPRARTRMLALLRDASGVFLLSWIVVLGCFRFSGISASQGAVLLIALADTVVHAGLPAALALDTGVTGIGLIAHAIAFIVLIPIIRGLSDNHDWLIAIRAAFFIRVTVLLVTFGLHALAIGVGMSDASGPG